MGVAVEVDFLEEIVELIHFQCDAPGRSEGRIPAVVRSIASQIGVFVPCIVIADEMHLAIEHELLSEFFLPRQRSARVFLFVSIDGEDRTVDLVHRHKSRRHAHRATQELAEVHALFPAIAFRQAFDPRLNLALLLVLWQRIKLGVGNHLGRDGRAECRLFGRSKPGKLTITQKSHCKLPSLKVWLKVDRRCCANLAATTKQGKSIVPSAYDRLELC